MHRFLSYALVLTSFVAAYMIMVVNPQTTALHKKRIKNYRPFLLAQSCPQYQAGCPGYEQWTCEMNQGTWTNGECAYHPACWYNGTCGTADSCTSQGYYWYNGICNTNPQSGGSSGGSSPAASGGQNLDLAAKERIESQCMRYLDESESPFGPSKKAGVPISMLKLLQDICFPAQDITRGRNGGGGAFAYDAPRAVEDAIAHALRSMPAPEAAQTIDEYAETIGVPLFKSYAKAVDGFVTIANGKAGSEIQNDFLLNPMLYLLGGTTIRSGKNIELVGMKDQFESAACEATGFVLCPPKKEIAQEESMEPAESTAEPAAENEEPAPSQAEEAPAAPPRRVSFIQKMKNALIELRETIMAIVTVRPKGDVLKKELREQEMMLGAFRRCRETGEGCS